MLSKRSWAERTPEIYAVLGAAWILITSLAIPWLSGSSLESAELEVAKGLGFVGVSSLLIWHLVSRRRSAGAAAEPSSPLWAQLSAVLALSVLAAVIGAAVGLRRNTELVSQEQTKLQLVAELVSSRLGAWRDRRLADAERMRGNRAVHSALLETGTQLDDAHERVAELERLDGLDMALYDTRCQPLEPTHHHTDDASDALCALTVAGGNEVVWRIARNDDAELVLELGVPMVRPGSTTIGIATMRERLGERLLPDLREGVSTNPSIGSFLLRRTAGSLELLADLRSEGSNTAPDSPEAVVLVGDSQLGELRNAEGDELIGAYAKLTRGNLAVLTTSRRTDVLGAVSPAVTYGFRMGALALLVMSLALYGWRSRSEALLQGTARANAERELAQKAQRHWEHLVLELPEVGVCLAEVSTGKLVYVNEHLGVMLGQPREVLLGSAWQDVASPDGVDTISQAAQALLEGTLEEAKLESYGPGPDGRPRHTVTELHPIRDGLAVPTHVAVFVHDVTDEKLQQEERERMLREQHAGLLASIDAIGRMIEVRDPYTAGHQRKVSQLAGAIGEELGLDEHRVEGLRVAGKIHDLGKVSCPAEILVKPGPLTEPERDIARQHVEVGAKILGDLALPWPLSEIVHQHHEHVDGSGYPRQLRGDDILLEAKVIRVASSYVALTSHRPYRPARSMADALSELEQHAGTRYDAEVVAACARLIREGRVAEAKPS